LLNTYADQAALSSLATALLTPINPGISFHADNLSCRSIPTPGLCWYPATSQLSFSPGPGSETAPAALRKKKDLNRQLQHWSRGRGPPPWQILHSLAE